MEHRTLKMLIKYMYTGRLESHDRFAYWDFLDLLKLANYLYLHSLQEKIISDILIPQMEPQSSVHILRETIF